jgi:hypothetical protein
LVATQLGIAVLATFIFGIMFSALNQAVGLLQAFQLATWPTGVFPADILTFVESAWQWFPFVVLLVIWLMYVPRQALRRGNPAEAVSD